MTGPAATILIVDIESYMCGSARTSLCDAIRIHAISINTVRTDGVPK